VKKLLTIASFFSLLLIFSACKKTDSNTIPYGSSVNYSSNSGVQVHTGGAFSFTKIIINPSPVKIGTASKITAVATGNNLTFTWSTSHGDLFGKGSTIYYSDSCIGEYTVTCTVSDGSRSATITVSITVSN
jgi:hypothetical protein